MITPIFRLSQDEQYLYVTIVAPNMRLAEAELFHEGTEFIFHAKPYYLRLELPGSVQTSERTEKNGEFIEKEDLTENLTAKKMQFNFDTNELLVPVPKVNAGEHFPDLEMIGKFLSGPKSKASRRLVEVLETDQGTPLIDDLKDEEEEDFDWNIEQKLPSEEICSASALLGREPYGFGNGQTGVVERLGAELTHELVDIKEPGKLSRSQRRQQRLQSEEADFCEDHYIADLYETERIEQLIAAPAPWDTWDPTQVDSILSDEDRLRMIEHLPRRDFIKYDHETIKALLLGAVDILYAWAYDYRTTDFEHSSESGWTIRKLSPTLSWFEFWTRINDLTGDLDCRNDGPAYVLASCVRRALIYPLYRNWTLALKVAGDVATILSKGRTAVLKCFLDLHQLFNKTGDNHYLLNDLYITDYCCWLQRIKSSRFENLAAYLGELLHDQHRISKAIMRLDLELTEKAAEIAWNEAQEQELSKGLQESLRINAMANELDSDDDEPN